jgi:hypothetical protein
MVFLFPSLLPSFLPNERWCMSSPTFPTPDPDAPDPVGGNDGDPQSPQSPQSPETPEPCDEEDSAAYLEELMAAVAAGEELTAGDISGAGFGQDGTAQQDAPGPGAGHVGARRDHR